MQSSDKERIYIYTVVEDIHNYAKKIAWTKRRLAALPQGDIGIRFIDKLKFVGKLTQLGKNSIPPSAIDVPVILSVFDRSYKPAGHQLLTPFVYGIIQGTHPKTLQYIRIDAR